jgi:iron complex transport system substrate-binding protein
VFFARENAGAPAPILVGLFYCLFSRNSRQGRFVQRVTSIFVSRPATLVLAFLFVATIGVSAQANSPRPSSQPATREVVDEMGRSVRIPVSPARIISLAPSITETIYALGLQGRLVGDTDYCDYPPDAQKKPKVGGIINPNLEEIAALRPDLVLVTKSINRLDTVRALDTLGIPTYAATDPHTVAEIISSTQKLADVLGASDAGKSLSDELQGRLSALQTKLAAVPTRRVLFIVWTEPLISAGKDTFIADALRKAGGVSIVEATQDWPQMSLEEVVHLQPDYLVFAASHSESAARDFEALAPRPGWRLLDAVRNRHFAVISDAVNRPAPRIVSAIEELARQLHPEVFQDSPAPEKVLPPVNTAPAASPRAALSSISPSNCSRSTESSCVH